jgi:hypothetical protein
MSTKRAHPAPDAIARCPRKGPAAVVVALLALTLPLLGACDDGDGAAATGPEADGLDVSTGLTIFRNATERYRDIDAAIADGFEPILPCLANPDGRGALGVPYAKLDRFDSVIDLEHPEILFYEPQQDGDLELVGGEPVVPIEAWSDDDPPSLFGREFHRNEEHGLYGLHMWVWRYSPDGALSFWNANVSCEFAG